VEEEQRKNKETTAALKGFLSNSRNLKTVIPKHFQNHKQLECPKKLEFDVPMYYQ